MNHRSVLINAFGLASLIGFLVLTMLASPAYARPSSAAASAAASLPEALSSAALSSAALSSAAPSSVAPSPTKPGATQALAKLIDANQADSDGLQQVRGIGPAIAGRIVQERERRGLFQSLDELKTRVPGIGPNNLARMRAAGLTVSAPPTITSVESAARDRVDMVVGNRLHRPDPRAGGRVIELRPGQAIMTR